MTFGDYDSSIIKGGSEDDGYGVHWYGLSGTTWWQIDLKNARLGSSSFMSASSTPGILDTGTSLIAVPSADFTDLSSQWKSVSS